MSWNQGGQYGHNQQAYGPNNGQWNAGPNQWQGAGGQYPPPSQPYAAPVNPPVVGFSDYKAKTEEYGERFKPKKRINDIPFLILFIAQLLGFAAVSGIAINSWVSNGSLSSGGVGGSRQGGTNVTLNSHTVYLLLFVTAAGLVFSTIYLLLVRAFTSVILQVTLVLSVVANIAIAVYYWVTKYYSGAIIFTIIAVFGILAYFGMRSRIPLASLMLQVVMDVSKHHKSVYVVAFSGLIAQATLSVWFIFTAIATYAKWTPNNATCQNGSSCSSGTVTGLIFFELFSYLWTSQVIGNVCLATMAGGPYGGWYYFGPSNMGQMPKNPSLSAFVRASTLSLGSIAFGSLIVTLLELLRIILNSIRANAAESGSPVEAALACCAACFVGCIESLVEYFNRYAYIEIALYGKPYIPAAKDTWRLFKDRGIDALINDSLTGIAMTWGAYLVGLLCSLLAYVYLRLTNPAYNADGQYTAPVLLFAFVIGLQCSLTLASAIEAGVSTIFVGLGEDPHVLAERSPGLFEMIRETYPDVVRPVGV
ncbi:Protein PNS1 OS=Cryptococcus neoformans var, neoformans serotype D (strain JEC21 / ATCC MYA-565) GN=PNS1 PE=3 SV=1 [Rhizoctonia solani AG-1 IB]|uniref:Protein PNS1 n=1 Tax=Thanatephorus cucumeris (strain AG1-IB / isolate 7/3/14) TaxID=1108050 RepID=A0A0B7FWC9_THACB|nr:Protein PNS1 OS=Cryptococcus neoformans var, neoformans serotype D (strain JEC21 / ATCC MYA-565) GN=PNS1 PE=3 SV=1 [Rhizoctonia solani AG-1 IB]